MIQRKRYIKVIEEHAKSKPELAAKLPELRKKFEECETKQSLEDLYLPFKAKRKTKAAAAREKGLLPLLEMILEKRSTIKDLNQFANEFLTQQKSEDNKVLAKTSEEALGGAQDIYAEELRKQLS